MFLGDLYPCDDSILSLLTDATLLEVQQIRPSGDHAALTAWIEGGEQLTVLQPQAPQP